MSLSAELRLADLVTLLAVQRTGTISGAARELRVTPSQVSKAVSRLERHYGVRLLSRSARGVSPTPAARRMLPRIASAVDALLATNGWRDEQGPEVELAVAGPSYLVSNILPAIVLLLSRGRVRGLELAPAAIRANIAENVFDVALVPGGIQNHPASWTSEAVGEIRSGLLGNPSFVQRLGPLPLTIDRVRGLPFVGPTTGGGDRFVAVSDDCPLSREERVIAHEAQMIGAALELAAGTDHLVYGPLLSARRFLEAGILVEVPVAGWNAREPLYLLCNSDRVLARTHDAVVQAIQQVLGVSCAASPRPLATVRDGTPPSIVTPPSERSAGARPAASEAFASTAGVR
ncbi:MAG: LysR family transcriptional regulator [Myxococcota bacterium]|nr:LysR family transcriptional regulator [Myxococcota bacterium]